MNLFSEEIEVYRGRQDPEGYRAWRDRQASPVRTGNPGHLD